jgi:hypothetical protein
MENYVVSPRLGDEKWEMTTMSIPQNEQRKLKKDIKDSARDRVFKDIEAAMNGLDSILPDARKELLTKIRDLVDTYAKVETTVLTRERMNEAWARMKKNA